MATTAELIAMRDKLLSARLSGVRSYKDQNGESVTYGTDAELAAALAAVDAQIRGNTRPTPHTIYIQSSKGV